MNSNEKIAEKLAIDPSQIDNTYSEPDPERDKIRNIVWKSAAAGLGVASVLGICNGIANINMDKATTEAVENETTVDAEYETSGESDENGFPEEFSEYTVQPNDNLDRIAGIICASANIKPDAKIVEIIKEYILDTNYLTEADIEPGDIIDIPAYLADEFKKRNGAEQALPEADSPLDPNNESDPDYYNQFGIIISDEAVAIQVDSGQTIIDVARQIPGFPELEKAHPNLAKQVLNDIAAKNRGSFGSDGLISKGGFVIVGGYVALNNPNLASYFSEG